MKSEQLNMPNPEHTQSTNDGTASAAPLDIEQQDIVNEEQPGLDNVDVDEMPEAKSVEHTTPTKENSPGKSSTMSLGKLDLGKVES